jgi:uncharacterized protein (TIGR03435 family)
MKFSLPVLLIFICSQAWPQSSAPVPAFDAASIRAIEPGLRRQENIQSDPGSLRIQSSTLRSCIQWAYEVDPAQISGPDWLGDTRFDITAKSADAADTDRLRLMLRTLLAERFGLKLHHESKALPVYSMILAPNGPRLHSAGPKDASKFLQSADAGPMLLGGDKTGLVAERVAMPELAAELSKPLMRPVIDRTGLKGRYDIRVDVTAFMVSAGGDGDGHGPIDEMSIIFSAFPAQLGLKLEPGKETVEFLVVDSADKVPTDN